jgi:hypothetical protein
MEYKQKRFLDRVLKDTLSNMYVDSTYNFDIGQQYLIISTYVTLPNIHTPTDRGKTFSLRREITYKFGEINRFGKLIIELPRDNKKELLIDIIEYVKNSYGVKDDELPYIWDKVREKINTKVAGVIHLKMRDDITKLNFTLDNYSMEQIQNTVRKRLLEKLYGFMHEEGCIPVLPPMYEVTEGNRYFTYQTSYESKTVNIHPNQVHYEHYTYNGN